LLESAYDQCLRHELGLRGIRFQYQVPIPVNYKGAVIADAYRADLLVEDQVVVELKALSAIEPIHAAQLLTYLRLLKRRIGLLINFNVPVLRDGIRRMIND